jgi:predicted SAM-dependent methyltransferase
MAVSDISAKRSFFSYAKVQRALSRIIRNKRLFFSKRAADAKYLNVGCGMHPMEGYVNLDWHWCPGVDVCWDLRKPYPFSADRFDGIYCEHCIDGLPREWFMPNLREMVRVLKPGGTLRISFCDSELYVDAYVQWRASRKPTPFMEERGHRTGMQALDWIYHHVTHQTLIDFETLELHLREAGFSDVKRVGYREGRDTTMLIDKENRRPESIYVEAVK